MQFVERNPRPHMTGIFDTNSIQMHADNDFSESSFHSSVKTTPTKTFLRGKWNLYFHLPADKNTDWSLASYQPIQTGVATVEDTASLFRALPDNLIKYGLLYWFRDGIGPVYEDPHNRGMGAFSYIVSNRLVCEVWRNLCYALAGESICIRPEDARHVNGVTISPKKGFCCIKIWMDTLEYQDSDMFVEIPGLTRSGVLMKKHPV
jgi:hypothetical protein